MIIRTIGRVVGVAQTWQGDAETQVLIRIKVNGQPRDMTVYVPGLHELHTDVTVELELP